MQSKIDGLAVDHGDVAEVEVAVAFADEALAAPVAPWSPRSAACSRSRPGARARRARATSASVGEQRSQLREVLQREAQG